MIERGTQHPLKTADYARCSVRIYFAFVACRKSSGRASVGIAERQTTAVIGNVSATRRRDRLKTSAWMFRDVGDAWAMPQHRLWADIRKQWGTLQASTDRQQFTNSHPRPKALRFLQRSIRINHIWFPGYRVKQTAEVLDKIPPDVPCNLQPGKH